MSRRTPTAAKTDGTGIPQPVPSALPPRYTPRVAGYARGPFLNPVEVTPTGYRWRNARVFNVLADDGLHYRAIRVSTPRLILIGTKAEQRGTSFAGWWAVELLGTQLPLVEWEDGDDD